MKINALYDAFRPLEPGVRAQARMDGEGGQQSGQEQEPKNPDEDKTPIVQVNSENVEAAIIAFRGDVQAQAAGLRAQAIGQGPGLKVILKDGTGAIVRQFTGEEFLKLREAVKDGRASGKILDQKL